MGTAVSGEKSNVLEALIVAQASSHATSPFLLDAHSPRVVSYAELDAALHDRRQQLTSFGFEPGSRVGLLLNNPIEFSLWFLAGLASGVWVAPLDPTITTVNLFQVFERARALEVTAILTDRDAPLDSSLLWLNVERHDTSSIIVTIHATASDPGGGVLLSSSGTTGTPKIMALSLEQLLTNASLIARHNQLDVDDRGFNPLPLWHVNAEVVGLLATLCAGASLVLDDRFHRTGFWKLIHDFEVTWINAVPAIVSHLSTLHDGEIAPTSVRFLRSASSPLAPSLLKSFEALTEIPIIQSYGMTEAASQICVNPLDGVRKVGSVGVAVGAEVRVVALDEATLAKVGDVGDIEIKGPTVIRAYESAAYADRFDIDGWLRTGDLGYLDEDGYLFIVGRTDDVINRGGEKIYPLEIENVLASIEGVAAIAVIGEADDVFGQVPVAYVQPVDSAMLDSAVLATEFVQRVREIAVASFSKAHRPAKIKLVSALPAHANGKIRRGLLREGEVTVAFEERL